MTALFPKCHGERRADRAGRATKLLPRDRDTIMDRRYFSCAALASYDDSEPPANPGRAFSQEEVNRLLADDRRKHQARIDRVQRTLEEVSASKNLVREGTRATRHATGSDGGREQNQGRAVGP